MWQFGVELQCGFVDPARMDVKEPRVAQGFFDGAFLPFPRMQPDKGVLLHGYLPLPTSFPPASHATLSEARN